MNLPTFAAALAMGTTAWAGGPTTTQTSRKPAATKVAYVAPVRKTPAAPAATAKPAATNTAAKRVTRKPPVAVYRVRQMAPTPDRYREIQEALVARGYLPQEEANGAWGPASTEALKKFQADQTLDTTGRIDSLSLIALGLGPRHDYSTVPRVVDGAFQPEYGRN
jgi:hypothetical protein